MRSIMDKENLWAFMNLINKVMDYKKVNIKNAKPGDFITIFDMYGFPTVFIFKGFKRCGNDYGCDCYCYSELRSESVGFVDQQHHIGYINGDCYYEPTPKTKECFLSVLKKNGYEWKSDTLELIHHKKQETIEDYVKRMLAEFKQLDERVMKLGAFLNGETYKTLPIEEQQDMYDQWHAMVLYKSALGRRLVRKGFKDIFNKGDGA